LRDRQFVEIDRDSFKDIFAKINPRSSFTVDNLMRVPEQGATELPKLPIEITAQAPLDNSKPLDALLMNLQGEDPLYMFHPLWVIRQTPELNTLYEARGRLTDLLSKLDGNDKLAAELKVAVNSPDKPAELTLNAASYPHTNGAKQLSTSQDEPARAVEKSAEKVSDPVQEPAKNPEKPGT
jgi:type VI secretion system protein ImpB